MLRNSKTCPSILVLVLAVLLAACQSITPAPMPTLSPTSAFASSPSIPKTILASTSTLTPTLPPTAFPTDTPIPPTWTPTPTATLPPLPTKTSTRLLTPTAQPVRLVMPTATAEESGLYSSPNGEYTALAIFPTSRVVITSRTGRTDEVIYNKWIQFVGWTADSRYAIMNYYDQYGNMWAHAFDTVRWEVVPIAPTVRGLRVCLPTTEGNCKEGVKTITSDGQSVMLYNGTFVKLADLTK